MDDNNVGVVELGPMRVASFRAVGESPEQAALDKMSAWARPKGWLEDAATHPVYGFDNPPPSEVSKEYGYEVWIQAEPGIPLERSIETKECAGGLYAVTTVRVGGDPWKTIPAGWQRLVDWISGSEYEIGKHQHFEKYRQVGVSLEDLVLDLHCPIQKEEPASPPGAESE